VADKSANVPSARNGDTVIYTIHVTNNTGVTVTITQIQDTLNAFMVTGCSSSKGGVCTPPILPVGTLSWDGSATLANGESMDLVIEGVITGATTGTQLCNPSYTIRWDQGLPVTHNNQACVDILP
jgi:uncharacterized repeat protein (TIGR01451 family)